MAGKKIGYIRVSTALQNEARQVEELAKLELDKTFTDKKSGKDTNREQFQAMMNYVRDGDTIYITDFSRLSRSVMDLLTTINYLTSKGVKVISLKEKLDSSAPQGKLMIAMIGAINQFERDVLLERQREGIAIAKRNGKYKGRKSIPKPTNWDEVIKDYYTRRLTATKAMKLMGLKPNTFYKFLNNERKNDDLEINL